MGFIHDEVASYGHEVHYFCSEDAAPPPVHRSFRRFSFPLAILRHAESKARSGQPYDIINVHEPSAAAVSMLRRNLGGARIFVTSHGIERRGWNLRLAEGAAPGEKPASKSRILYPATLLWQADLALRKADHIFCLNSEDRNYLAGHYGRKTVDVTRIFPGAHPVFGRKARERNYGAARSILFAGSWLARKGICELVPAFVRLARNYTNLRLKILNPGVDSGTVLRAFPEECRSRVDYLLARPEEGTASVMESSDIFVLPSRFEGTPLTMMEAMWSGLPIVSTSVCGMKDVILHDWNGLLVGAGNSGDLSRTIECLLNDGALRTRLGRQAHADAEAGYKWSDAARVVRQAYESILQSQVGSSRLARLVREAGDSPLAHS